MTTWFDPLNETPEGQLLKQILVLEKAIIAKKKTPKQFKPNRGDEKKPELPSPKKGKNVIKAGLCKNVECNDENPCESCYQKPAKVKKSELDLTSQIIQKYQQEPVSDNGVPIFMDFAGGTPVQAASGYYTNQTIPHMEDGPSRSPISETFAMPAYSQTGYGETGSTLHMHLTDGGNSGNPPNRSPVEESMTALKKGATVGQMGIIEEIGELLTQVYARL